MGLLPSGSVHDSEYLLARSTTEIRLAANASTEQAAAAHRKIASCYLARLFTISDSASSDARLTNGAITTAKTMPFRSSRVRFEDLRSIAENDELNRLLRRLP